MCPPRSLPDTPERPPRRNLELSRRIAAIPGGAELLSKTVCPILTEDAFILDVTLTCVEDIALSVPIRVDG